MMRGGELDGLLVVAMEQAVAAPYCSLLLADAGARVIKLERPEGDFCRRYDRGADGESTWFAWLNRGKESLVVDFTRPEDAALMHRLIRRADVFLHNLAPGALARHGFGSDTLRKGNPGLISLGISGYGSSGAAAEMKAYDFLVQAEAGLCAVTGSAEAPARVGVSLCDIGAGLTAYAAILRALIGRGRSGAGADIQISLFDVMADWMNMPLLAQRYLPAKPVRMGLAHPLLAPYGAYACKGGAPIMLAIQNEREWERFCTRVLARPELGSDARFADNSARIANRAALDSEIGRVFSAHDRDAVAEMLQEAGIAWARLNGLDDLARHPFLRPAEAHFGSAVVRLADLPVRARTRRRERVPALDQQGAAIRREFAR